MKFTKYIAASMIALAGMSSIEGVLGSGFMVAGSSVLKLSYSNLLRRAAFWFQAIGVQYVVPVLSVTIMWK